MEKKRIYYARTYRHLNPGWLRSILFLALLVIPSLAVLVINLKRITGFISDMAAEMLGDVFQGIPLYIVEDEFSILGSIKFIDMPTVYPKLPFVFANLLVVLVAMLLLNTRKTRGKPLSIYMTLGLLIHMINCIYFIFASNYFPYTTFQYSALYMKQQVGIWITFIVLSGLVIAFVGSRRIFAGILTFVGIIAYSFVFGAVRYIVFLYLIQKFSILYMAPMFFVLGPFFDFLYLVSIYGVFINKMVRYFNSEKGQEEWRWS